MEPRQTAAILMACHGDPDITKAATSALKRNLPQEILQNTALYAIDDQCPNNSAEAAVAGWQGQSRIIRTEKPLFWAKSMRLAETEAKKEDPSFLIWLNQDTIATNPLEPLFDPYLIGVATCLINQIPAKGPLVENGAKGKYRVANEHETAITFNGNLVVVPQSVYRHKEIKPYQHAFADLAYGLEAYTEGTRIRRAGVLATTEPQLNNWRDQNSISKRIKACLAPTGLPPSDWWQFSQEFGVGTLRFLLAYRYILMKRRLATPVVKPEIRSR